MIIHIPVADKTVAIEYSDKLLTSRFKTNYMTQGEKHHPLCSISIEHNKGFPGYALYVKSSKAGIVAVGKGQRRISFRTVNFFLKAIIQFFALREKIILLHASSLAKKNKAYVVLGPSGAGKSTVLHFARGFDVLADDTAVIKKEAAGYYIYPSPFDRKKRPEIYGKPVRVKELYILHKSSSTRVEPVRKNEAMRQLFSCSFLQEYFTLIAQNPRLAVPTATHNLLKSFFKDIAGNVPVTNLFFRKNRDFLDVLT